MKRTLWTAFVLVTLLFVADEVRSHLQRYVSEIHSAGLGTSAWLNAPSNFLLVNVIIYAMVFATAGALMAWQVSSAVLGVVLALMLGLAVPLITLVLESPRPFYFSTHAPWWLEVLFWANWYMPPIAAVLGALTWNSLSSRVRHGQNAA